MTSVFLRSLLATIVLASFPACEAVGPKDGPLSPSDSVKQTYRQDARQLVVRKMVDDGDMSVGISDARVDRFFDALLRVYEADNIAARDSIVDLHAFPDYNLREINVGVDSTEAWTQAWAEGQRETGNEAIDTLMEQHNLTLERYIDGLAAGTLRSEDPLNPVGLSKKFEGVEGIRYAEQNGFYHLGRKNDIRATVLDDAIELRYSRAWGDCPAGCLHRRTWTFRVTDAGSVSFEGRTTE